MPIGGKFDQWCHMWTDGTDNEELRAMAQRLGVSDYPHHSRGASGEFHHYDLSPAKRARALRLGAEYANLREWIRQRLAARRHK